LTRLSFPSLKSPRLLLHRCHPPLHHNLTNLLMLHILLCFWLIMVQVWVAVLAWNYLMIRRILLRALLTSITPLHRATSIACPMQIGAPPSPSPSPAWTASSGSLSPGPPTPGSAPSPASVASSDAASASGPSSSPDGPAQPTATPLGVVTQL
jgi:hypothetical protein